MMCSYPYMGRTHDLTLKHRGSQLARPGPLKALTRQLAMLQMTCHAGLTRQCERGAGAPCGSPWPT